MLIFRMFVYTVYPELRGELRSVYAGPRSACIQPFRSDAHFGWQNHPSVNLFTMNTCKSVSKQRTLSIFRINTYEKHRGWGHLLLTRHPLKGVCPERPSGVKDLSCHPMRMRILSEHSESKDLSSEFGVQMLRRSGVATFPRSDTLFLRSCRSLNKECLRNLLKSKGSTLSSKTGGWVPERGVQKGFPADPNTSAGEPTQVLTESARSCVPSTSGCYTASGALSGRRFPIAPGTAASTARAIAAPCGDTKAIRGMSHDPR